MRGTVVNTPRILLCHFLLAFCTGNDSCAGTRAKKDLWKYLYGALSFISIFTVMFFTDGIKQMFFMPLMICDFFTDAAVY